MKKAALQLGADLFGVADVRDISGTFMLTEKTRERCPRAVCMAVRLSQGVLEEIATAPTRLYFHHYRTANAVLDQLAFRLARFIEQQGFRALAIPASQIVDWQNQKAHLSHKHAALRAGIGWIGRNNLLVTEKLGAQVRLVTILTDMPLATDSPSENRCGSCRLCAAVCPAGAIRETPAEFDHRGCFEKLKEFQKLRLVDQYICGVCVNVCKGKITLKKRAEKAKKRVKK